MNIVPLVEAAPLSRDAWTRYLLLTETGDPAQRTEDEQQLCRYVQAVYPEASLRLNAITSVTIQRMITSMSLRPETAAPIWRDLAGALFDFSYHESPPMERLLIEHIVVCFLQVALIQFLAAGLVDRVTIQSGVDKRLTSAQGRFLRAVESLARVRRLTRGMPVQINIGGEQVNIAHASLPLRN